MHNKKEMRDIAEALTSHGSGKVLRMITHKVLAARILAARAKRKGDTEMSKEKIKPGPTSFEKELSVEVRITALNGANVKGIRITPDDLKNATGQRFVFEEIMAAITSGFRMDVRLRADYVKRLGIDKDLGGE